MLPPARPCAFLRPSLSPPPAFCDDASPRRPHGRHNANDIRHDNFSLFGHLFSPLPLTIPQLRAQPGNPLTPRAPTSPPSPPQILICTPCFVYFQASRPPERVARSSSSRYAEDVFHLLLGLAMRVRPPQSALVRHPSLAVCIYPSSIHAP